MRRISQTTIDDINARADIAAVIGEYVRLERRADEYWGCCPFHGEKTPSFHVRPEKRSYYCFGCGKGGGLINFIMEIEKLTYPQAVEFLAKKIGVVIQYEGSGEDLYRRADDARDKMRELYARTAKSFRYILTSTAQGKPALDYLQNRRISSDTAEKFTLGYAPADRYWLKGFLKKKGYSDEFLAESGLFSKKYPDSAFFSNRLMFPITDRHGAVVAFGGRILSGDGPKYLNSGETAQYKKGETLFAFSQAFADIRKRKTAILCEGYMDAIAYHQAGVCCAVAPLGTAFTEDQAKILRSFADKIILSFDCDGAGAQATYKAILLCKKFDFDVSVVILGNAKDPAEILQNFGEEVLQKSAFCDISDFDYLMRTAKNNYNMDGAAGKASACSFFFSYLDALKSQIQRDECLEKISAELAVNYQSLASDYAAYAANGVRRQPAALKKTEPLKSPTVKKNAELRAALAVASNMQCFAQVRAAISPDDFEDEYAKNIFIAMEECYRAGTMEYEDLLKRCPQDVRGLIMESAFSGEFSHNSQKTVEDSVSLIRKNSLIRKRTRIVNRLRQYGGSSQEDMYAVKELMSEKNYIDDELARL